MLHFNFDAHGTIKIKLQVFFFFFEKQHYLVNFIESQPNQDDKKGKFVVEYLSSTQ